MVALVACAACHAQEQAFWDEIFRCDPHGDPSACGTTKSGKPMTCYPASQLGGEDFCTETCDPASGSQDPGFICVSPGAKLKLCHPHGAVDDPSMGCPSGLHCYRTDLLTDEGVCLDVNTCTTDADCGSDHTRRVCGATLARQLYPPLASNIDNLACLQPSCKSSGMLCAPGESCLANYYDVGLELPDICVPNCDPTLHCPPNYACVAVVSGGGSPPICVPGVPGARCQTALDCIAGECFDTGLGFGECTLPINCVTDLDCAPLDGPDNTFACIASPTGDRRGCVSLTPLHGANCSDSAQCSGGQECYRYSAYVVDQGKGECRPSCKGGQACPARAGIPHVCLDDGDGGCVPGEFGLPCKSSSECLAEFTCQTVSPDERTLITSPNICTTTCTQDSDCSQNPLIRTGGFCKEGLCRMTGLRGAPCDRDAQCDHGSCAIDFSGNGQCAT
jgi:hypothetical protein